MQLETFFCESVGGVFCAGNNSYPTLEDLTLADRGSSLDIMSVSGDRKRKYIASSASNEREIRSEQSRQNSIRLPQHRQCSEDNTDNIFAGNDQSSYTITTKKAKSRKASKVGKFQKNSDTRTFEEQEQEQEQELEQEQDQFQDDQYHEDQSNEDQHLIQSTSDCFNPEDKIESSSNEYSNKNDDSKEDENDNGTDQGDCETIETHNKICEELNEKPNLNSNEKDCSNDLQELIEDKNESRNKNKSPSLVDNLYENDIKNICDDSTNDMKISNTKEVDNNFLKEKSCDSSTLYGTHQSDTNIESTHLEIPEKEASPLFKDVFTSKNEHIESDPSITPIDDGCADNSKFTKLPNVAHDTNSNIESECDTANERSTPKENNYQFSEQTYATNYKQELDKCNITNERKSSECSEPSWEPLNQNQRYSDTTNPCHFRVTGTCSNLEDNLKEQQTQENKITPLDSYSTNPMHQAYAIQQQQQQQQQQHGQKETPTEEATDNSEMINSKNDLSEMTKLQSEQQEQQHQQQQQPQQQQQIHQEDFSSLSLQHTNRHQLQSQHEHYRQYQHPDHRSSYDQMFNTDQRGQQQQMQPEQHSPLPTGSSSKRDPHSQQTVGPSVDHPFNSSQLLQQPEQQQQQQLRNPDSHSQQYTQEQFYQMSRLQQQHHHIGQVMPLMHQQHPNLQDSLQEEHLMAYLHHHAAMAGVGHQSRLQQDIYQDLMMDEFHEEANPAVYKLRHLSPTTAKHENQDDGYETSAGDVLTPNSHSSSTHSGTPQLPVSLHAPTSSLALQNVSTNCGPNSSDQQQHPQIQHTSGTNTLSSENFNPDTAVNINHDPYKFTVGDSNVCLNDKVERLFPMQSERQPNPHNHNSSERSIHEEGQVLGSIKTDMVDMIVNKESAESLKPPQKRRGRKKKNSIIEGMSTLHSSTMINPAGNIEITDADGASNLLKVKERKKHDRFNGMSEEEVVKRTLPDHLCQNLDIVIIGINPGLFAAYKGHHYAGPGNHFWKCLYLSGLTQEQMSADEDYKLIKCGIGFTNMVQRATKGSADLTRKEIKEGSRILLEKLKRFQPKIAVFNGKLIFEVFSGKKDFNFGRQPECVEGTNTYVWVMPSSSARCAQLPRAADKVPFYAALKKFRDYLNGLVPQIDESECVFTEQRIRQMCEQEQLKNMTQTHSSCSYRNVIDCPSTSADQEHHTTGGDYASYSLNDNQMNSGSLNVSESTIGGPGPPNHLVTHGGSGYLVPPNFPGPHNPTPEKKKRGRPKKLRIQEIIDPNTGQKIQITNAQHHQQSNANSDFNILNLSMISGEVPKKKRGRPKKIKTPSTEIHPSTVVENSSILLQSSKQSHNLGAPQQQQQSQQISLYNNPPNPSSVQQMYGASSSASPNQSPSLNSAIVGGIKGSVYTPPNNLNSAQMTSPTNENSGELGGNNNKPNLSESTPPPSSPNICAVDFEPPTTAEHRSQNELHSQELPTTLQQQQRTRFDAAHIVGGDNGTSDSFHQWMSPSHQFSYQTPSLQQDSQQSYQTEHNLSMQHRSQKQIVHENHQQSPHSPWQMSHRHSQHFESNENNHQQQQQPHYMNTMHTTSQHQHQPPQASQMHHQTVHHSTDVTTKSLSGLESLVDQIPTIAESEAAAAAVESRLQTLQRGSTPASFSELQAENYEGNIMSENRGSSNLGNSTNLGEAITDGITATSRNSSNGSNTPHFGISSATSCVSPINHYGLQRHGQTTSAASSPHAHTPYSGNMSGVPTFPLNSSSTTPHSPSVSSDLLTNSNTPPTIANSSPTTNTTTSHHLFSNFSVSHLAASSVTSCSSNNNNNNNNSSKTSDWQTSGARSPYHHSNLMAAAALQLHTAASSSSPSANPPHQMYIDPHTPIHHHPHHTHLSSPHQHHVQVNSLYSSAATQAAHTHHHPGMAVAYAAPPPTGQHHSHHVHNASGDYGAYGATAAAAAAAHMLHMPNPNYSPYSYSAAPPPPPVPTATTQNTYSSWNHHGHPTASSHHPHHLSMFERLKPSDIGSYSSF